jgi:putative NADH-flavin reductase
MRLIVFGASRGVGRALTKLALADGHSVTAVVRNPAEVALTHESLKVFAGDVTDAGSVRRHIGEHEIVFCTVGADRRGVTTLYSDAARNIAEAMDASGISRLILLSNFGVFGESGRGVGTATMALLVKSFLRATLEDHRRALDELSSRDLEWTAVRPLALTDGARTGAYRVVERGLPRGGTRISRADVADFMLKQLDTDQYVHRVPAIAY